jgi:hypothetical protein
MREEVKENLEGGIPSELVENILDNFFEMKTMFFRHEYRETALYGGRYAEGVFRIIQYLLDGSYTPIGVSLPNFHSSLVKFTNYPKENNHDSIRISIPKSLDVLYDIRNKRDVGHLGGDISENYIDSVLSLSLASWILCELLRIFYFGDVNKAQKLVNNLIIIDIPLIQDFNGFLRVLEPKMPLREKILSLVFYKNLEGITKTELDSYLQYNHLPNNVSRSLNSLIKNALIHFDQIEKKYFLTERGINFVTKNIEFSL